MTWGDVPPLFATNNIFPPDASADAKAENDLRHLFVRFGRTCDANYWPPSNGAKLEGVTELLRRHYKDTYRHLCLQTGVCRGCAGVMICIDMGGLDRRPYIKERVGWSRRCEEEGM